MKPARKQRPRGQVAEQPSIPGIKIYWLQSFLFLAAVLFAVAVLAAAYWLLRDNAAEHRQLADGTRIMALAIESELDLVRKRLEALGSDSRLREVFTADGPVDLSAEEASLAERLPSALSVNLMRPGQSGRAQGATRLTYAGLDLVRRAVQDARVTRIEVHRVGQADMHLATAAPVYGLRGEKVVGVVYVASPMSLLPEPAQGSDAHGILRYQQVVGEKPTTLDLGHGYPERDPDYVEPLPRTSLRLAAWVSNPGLVDSGPILVVAVAYFVLLALAGAILWLGYRGLNRDLAADFAGIRSALDDAENNRPLRKAVSRLAETQAVFQDVLSFLRTQDSGRAPLRGAAPLRSEPVPVAHSADLGDIVGPSSYLSEHSVEVEEIDLESEYAASYSDQISGTRGAPVSDNPLEDFGIAGQPPAPEVMPEVMPEAVASSGSDVIFRAYDIRGLVGSQLDEQRMRAIGQALATEAAVRGDRQVVVGRDNRASSPKLCIALIDGIRAAGLDVVDLGVVPTPLVYFACSHPDPQAGAMVTASHNPSDYNGVKPVINGVSADAETIQALRQRVAQGDFSSGDGAYRSEDVVADYRGYVEQDVAIVRPLKVVVDCGNATPAAVVPELYRVLGCEVVELDCEIAAGMAEEPLDPSKPEDCRAVAERVRAEEADVGLAFDADGDRLGVVDSEGEYVPADKVLMILAGDLLSRQPGSDVIFDVKCSRYLAEEIRQAGGRPIMWRSGHSPLKAKLRETGAVLAGELSGHIIFQERWFGFDDATYAGARLLEVLSLDPRNSHDIFAALPTGVATSELELSMQEGEPQHVMDAVMDLADRLDGVDVIRIDGLRAEFDRGWGLVRASNTQPKLTFRFEGDDQPSLEKIQSLFRRLMEKAAPGLGLPF